MKKKVLALVVMPIIALIGIACSVVPLIILAKNPFDQNSINSFTSVFNLSEMGVYNIWPFISICLTAVLFIVAIVFVIVKKRPHYLLALFVALIGSVVAVYCYRAMATMAAADRPPYVVPLLSAGVAVGLAVLFLAVTLLLFERKEKPKASEEKIGPKMEGAVEMDYDGSYEDDDVPSDEPMIEPEAPVEEEPKEEPVEEAPVEEEAPKAAPAKEPSPKAEASSKQQKTLGKYEVFPEAGFFKYRLKANNGEILLVSNGYRTREGARSGIATLKKNVPTGNAKIITDKNGFSQFRIFTSNDSRLVVAGEFYSSAANAQKALKSVERFYANDRIVDLEALPESEVREWRAELPPINANKNGKFEIFIDEDSKKWQGRLIANNGALLFLTSTYSTKNAVLNAYGNIQSKALEGDLSIYRDKQNRYHFRVISENGSVILMGETYPSRDSAVSAAVSVRNFVGNARIIDLTKPL